MIRGRDDVADEVREALVVGDDGGDADGLVGRNGGRDLGSVKDLLVVLALDVPVDSGDCPVRVSAGRGVEGQLVARARGPHGSVGTGAGGIGDGALLLDVVHRCRLALIGDGVHDVVGHGGVPVRGGVEAAGGQQSVEPGVAAAQLVAVEAGGRVGELVAVALGGVLKDRVDLVDLLHHPALVDLLDALTASGKDVAVRALGGEEVGVTDGDHRRVGGAGADVVEDRVVAVRAVAGAGSAERVHGGVDPIRDAFVAVAGVEGEEFPTVDAVPDDLAEACVVASDGEGDQPRVGVELVELGAFLVGRIHPVEVSRRRSAAGPEIKILAGSVADLVGVGEGRALAVVAVVGAGSGVVGRHPEAGGVGVTECDVPALGRGGVRLGAVHGRLEREQRGDGHEGDEAEGDGRSTMRGARGAGVLVHVNPLRWDGRGSPWAVLRHDDRCPMRVSGSIMAVTMVDAGRRPQMFRVCAWIPPDNPDPAFHLVRRFTAGSRGASALLVERCRIGWVDGGSLAAPRGSPDRFSGFLTSASGDCFDDSST